MATSKATDQLHQELAHRFTDGVEVVLFWHSPTNDLTVCVSDTRTGAYFELAADPSFALDVFQHPYAYAAFSGLDVEQTLPSWANAAAATTAC